MLGNKIALFVALILEFLTIKLEPFDPSTKLYVSKSTPSISRVPLFTNNVVFKLFVILLGLDTTSSCFDVVVNFKLFNVAN